MEILDYLFEKSKPPVDESDMPDEKTVLDGLEAVKAMLTFSHWNGEPRDLSTLRIGYQRPDWVATLTDGDNERSLTIVGKTVQEAIESLDRVLLSREPHWYYWARKNVARRVGKSGASSNGSGKKAKSPGR